MDNKFYKDKGYTIKAAIIQSSQVQFMENKIKEELFILQKTGREIESVSPITQTNNGLFCVITYKDFRPPSEHYKYYI